MKGKLPIFILIALLLAVSFSPTVYALTKQEKPIKDRWGRIVEGYEINTGMTDKIKRDNNKTVLKIDRKIYKIKHQVDKKYKEIKTILTDINETGTYVRFSKDEIHDTIGQSYGVFLNGEGVIPYFENEWVLVEVPHFSDQEIIINSSAFLSLEFILDAQGVQGDNQEAYSNFLLQTNALNFTIYGNETFGIENQTNLTNIIYYIQMNEGSGSLYANDTSTRGNNGTLLDMNITGNASSGWTTNCPTNGGSCLNFDGGNDTLNFSVSDLIGVDKGYISFWFLNSDPDDNVDDAIFSISNNASSTLTELGFDLRQSAGGEGVGVNMFIDGSLKWQFRVGTANLDEGETGVWHHFYLGHDGTNYTFYLDSHEIEVTRSNSVDESIWLDDLLSATAPATLMSLGGLWRNGAYSRGLNGSMDEFILSNQTVLNSTQIIPLSNISSQNITINSPGGTFNYPGGLFEGESFVFNQTGTDIRSVINSSWNISAQGSGLVNWSVYNNFSLYDVNVTNFTTTYVNFSYSVQPIQNGTITIRIQGLNSGTYQHRINESHVKYYHIGGAGVLTLDPNQPGGQHELILGGGSGGVGYGFQTLQEVIDGFVNIFSSIIVLIIFVGVIVIVMLFPDLLRQIFGDIGGKIKGLKP